MSFAARRHAAQTGSWAAGPQGPAPLRHAPPRKPEDAAPTRAPGRRGSLRLPCEHGPRPSAPSRGVRVIIWDFKTRFRTSRKGVPAERSGAAGLVEPDGFQSQLCPRGAQGHRERLICNIS